VFQPLRDPAQHGSNLSRSLVGRGSPILCDPCPPASFLNDGLCGSQSFLECVPLAFRPAGPFALCGQLAGQLPCPGFRGFSPLVQFGH
jgi:hypothetical protein